MIDAAISSAISAVLSPERLAAVVPLHAAWQHIKKTGDARIDHRQSRIRAQRWDEVSEAISAEFGAACGWRRGRQFSPMQLARGGSKRDRWDDAWLCRGERSALAWNHVEFFRCQRIPTAVLVHVYAPDTTAAREFGAAHCLTFKALPWSWYYPQGTRAGLYLRRASA
jgi:hypothetical protein